MPTRRGLIASSLLLAAGGGSALAQGAYPNRPVTWVVSYTPGGGADIVGRLVAPKVGEFLGQSVVIDNRGGAGGIIGTESVARAQPDGYTALVGIASNMTISPALQAKLPYDTRRDFVPVVLMCTTPYALVVSPSVPANNVRELIELAKAKPGQVAYASDGEGSVAQLGAELFAGSAGIKLLHVPYKTVAQSLTDVSSGQVQAMFLSAVSAQPHVKSGRLRALATTGKTRFSMMPELPTLAEAGVPGYELIGWYGIFVPAGTPAEVVSRMQSATVRALRDPGVRERLAGMGVEIVGNTPQEFKAFVDAEIDKWAATVRKAGIRVN